MFSKHVWNQLFEIVKLDQISLEVAQLEHTDKNV